MSFPATGIDNPAMDEFDSDLLEQFKLSTCACWVKRRGCDEDQVEDHSL
jgi:hypothetical protein